MILDLLNRHPSLKLKKRKKTNLARNYSSIKSAKGEYQEGTKTDSLLLNENSIFIVFQLIDVLPGCLAEHIPAIIPGIQYGLSGKYIRERMIDSVVDNKQTDTF